jgi:hypothetical protein
MRRTRIHPVEERIVRLALFLTADEHASVRMIREVLGGRSSRTWGRLDPRHVDRLVVLRSREVRERRAGEAADHRPDVFLPSGAQALVARLHRLPGQAMEAWYFHHVEGFGLRDVSRVMDCSTTAISRHLNHAERTLREEGPIDLASWAEEIRAALTAYEPREVITWVHDQRTKRRFRRFVRWVVVCSLVGLLVVVVVLTVAR